MSLELHAKLGKLDIGLEWAEAAKAALDVIEEQSAMTSFPDVDLRLLEQGKSRTGFVGVYFANGKFRAIVPDPTQGMGSKTLTGRTTALAAAVDRYRWHVEHGLPYGNLGWHVERHREQYPDKSVEEALLWARDLVANGTRGLKRPFTVDDVDRTLRTHRKRLGIAPPDDDRPYAGVMATPVDVSTSKPIALAIACAVCKDVIAEGEAVRSHPSAPDAWAHASCDDPDPA